MDVIESLRIAMRGRIIPDIVEPAEYQREWMNAPSGADRYIRETVMEYTREEDSQASERITVLCEYDVFIRNKAFTNPMMIASGIASRILAAFYVKDPAKVDVPLDDWSGGVAAFVARYNYGSPSQEEELFRLPVLIYVEIYFPASAVYGG